MMLQTNSQLNWHLDALLLLLELELCSLSGLTDEHHLAACHIVNYTHRGLQRQARA